MEQGTLKLLKLITSMHSQMLRSFSNIVWSQEFQVTKSQLHFIHSIPTIQSIDTNTTNLLQNQIKRGQKDERLQEEELKRRRRIETMVYTNRHRKDTVEISALFTTGFNDLLTLVLKGTVGLSNGNNSHED